MPTDHPPPASAGVPSVPFHIWTVRRRDELGLSQPEIARRLSTDKGTISGWENGQHVPKLARVQEIADAYEAPAAVVEQAIRASLALKRHGDGVPRRTTPPQGQFAQAGHLSHAADGSEYHRIFVVESWLRTLGVDPTGLSDPVATLQAEILKRGGARSLAEAAVIIDIVVGGERRIPRGNGHSHPRPRTNDAEHA